MTAESFGDFDLALAAGWRSANELVFKALVWPLHQVVRARAAAWVTHLGRDPNAKVTFAQGKHSAAPSRLLPLCWPKDRPKCLPAEKVATARALLKAMITLAKGKK